MTVNVVSTATTALQINAVEMNV